MTTSTTSRVLSVPDLRSQFEGRLLAPDDEGYDDARVTTYGGLEPRPALIVRPAVDADVVRTVTLARETGLPLAVRSGGHSPAAHSIVDGGIVLDLRDMSAIDIDVTGRTAWAETGLSAGEFTEAAGAYGLAVGFGDTASVGLGGLTLAHSMATAGASLILMTLGLSTSYGTANIVIQERAPDVIRGRVSAVAGMAFFGILPFSGLIVSSLADVVGLRIAMGCATAGYALTTILLLAGKRQLASASTMVEP